MAMSDTEMALMMGANQLAAMRPVNPGAFSGVEAGMMPPGAPIPMPPSTMPAAPAGAPMPMDEAGMMKYIQEKAQQIRERMAGQGAMSNADMGALEAVMAAMPQQQPMPQTPATQMPRSRAVGSGSMTDMEMKRMMAGAR